ncbi:hypothetical protein R5R35_007030 [Gryllus longicercus]
MGRVVAAGGGAAAAGGGGDDGERCAQNACETMPLLSRLRRAAPRDGDGGGGDGNEGRLSLGLRFAYGLGHVFNDVCAAMWFSYTLLFLQVVLGMPPILAGSMLLIGQVTDALATPVVGVLSDKKGSRKLWHLAGTGLVLISFPLIFSPCPGCDRDTPTLMALYYAAIISVFQIGWAVVQISHLAIIPDLTEDQEKRAGLTAIRYTASVCSSVAVYVITWCVFHVTRNSMFDSIGPEDAYKFRNIVLITTAIGLAASAYFHFGLKAHNLKPKVNTQTAGLDSLKKSSIASYFKSPLLFQVSFLHVASRLFLTISLVYMPLYLNETYGEDSEILALVPLVSYIASFAASLGIKYINNSWGSKTTYFIGAVISTFGCVWIRYGTGGAHGRGNVYGASILLGGGSSVTMVTSLCITAELIGTHTHNGAFVYSIVTFADKLFNGIAVMVIEDLKCSSQELCPHYYRDVLAYVCGGSAILGVLVLATMTYLSGATKILTSPTENDPESKNPDVTTALTHEVT